ncbi:MAG: chemotaxis protein CheC [Firmicutes bacterium]|nr:chemotaxis protein CheC [Bacillota bacterium]
MNQYTRFEDIGDVCKDMMREIGSIGTGNASTALSSLLQTEVLMEVPNVELLGFTEAVDYVGDPEELVCCVLVQMQEGINGMMLFLLKLDFINEILRRTLGKEISDYSELGELELSAVTEVGNIIISSFVLSMSKLVDVQISLSVPAVGINMLGGILSVPMAEIGHMSDKIFMIAGKCMIGGHHMESNVLLLPDIDSLNFLMDRLVRPYA